jgi:hypothetical protein
VYNTSDVLVFAVVASTCDSLGCLLHALSSGDTSASKLFRTAPGLLSGIETNSDYTYSKDTSDLNE